MSSKPKSITILGVTGSVGLSTVDVILSCPERFCVHGITANRNAEDLARLAVALKARKAVISDESLGPVLEGLLEGTAIEALSGEAAIEALCREHVDLVMAAIMGFAGLKPIMAALGQGINVAIANKEPLVAAGAQIMALARQNNAQILPVDSEHNAIFQVFEEHNRGAIDKIILTASGGPFLNWAESDIRAATPEQACLHPNWSMGRKISVDSASMMNKALEVIEAHYLFGLPAERIDVLIHPQSVVHSMVSYLDGSVLAQMGASDMRIPIASALAWPDRMDSLGQGLDFTKLGALSFLPADEQRFPALSLAYTCLQLGQYACIALNAANEVAVDEFLSGRMCFGDIIECVQFAVVTIAPDYAKKELKTVEDIIELDTIVRAKTHDYIADLKKERKHA